MSWFLFADKLSDEMGVMVERIPPIPTPSRRETPVSIPGRDGDLTIWDGTYLAFDLSLDCSFSDINRMQEVADWLSGAGDLVVSTAPSRLLRARVTGSTVYAAAGRKYRRFQIGFHCQPYKYEVSPESHDYTTGSAMLVNSSVVDALPTITFNGTIVINGATFITATELTVDAENMLVYKYVGAVLTPAYADLTGDIALMRLVPGENTITVTGTATIQPNWRWL